MKVSSEFLPVMRHMLFVLCSGKVSKSARVPGPKKPFLYLVSFHSLTEIEFA